MVATTDAWKVTALPSFTVVGTGNDEATRLGMLAHGVM
jgi:hypothetical protein